MIKIFRRVFLLLFATVLVVPLTVHAAKPVSQNFDASQVLYLPLHTASDAYMLVNNDFYTTEFPAMSTEWTKTGKTLPLETDRTYYIPQAAMVGVRLNGYTYFVLETGPKPKAGDLDLTLDRIEIWRINQTTGAVERRADMNAFTTTTTGETSFLSVKDLVKFNGELYLLLTNGKLMRSVDGTTWPEVTKTGMTTTTHMLYNITAGKDDLYMSTGSSSLTPTIYRSTDGNTWEAMTGDYQNIAGNIHDMTVYNGQVYAIIENASQQILWRSTIDGMTWENIMSTDQQLLGVDHTKTALYVVKYNSDSSKTTIVKSQADNNFYSVYDATGGYVKAQNMIKRYAKPLYIVMETKKDSTYLLRVK